MIVSSKKEALRMIVLYIDTIMRKAFLRLHIDTITHDSINTQYIEYTVKKKLCA